MKNLPGLVFVASIAFVCWVVWDSVRTPEQSDPKWHARCIELRVEFFERCMSSKFFTPDNETTAIARTDCEHQWAQLHGHVFEGDPRSHVVKEKDCSRYYK